MSRIFASLAVALALAAGVSTAHADGSLMVHGYQGINYDGR